MTSYLQSTPARLLALAVAVPLLSGLALSLGAGPAFYAFPLVGALGLTFVALGLGMDRHPGAALVVAIAFPAAVFGFLAVVSFVLPAMPSMAYLMAALGLAALIIAIRPHLPGRPGMAPTMRPRNV